MQVIFIISRALRADPSVSIAHFSALIVIADGTGTCRIMIASMRFAQSHSRLVDLENATAEQCRKRDSADRADRPIREDGVSETRQEEMISRRIQAGKLDSKTRGESRLDMQQIVKLTAIRFELSRDYGLDYGRESPSLARDPSEILSKDHRSN